MDRSPPKTKTAKELRGSEASASDKLRGGYYTPSEVANWVTRWAVRSKSDRVLEPSCGDGSFISSVDSLLETLANTGHQCERVAIEFDPAEAKKAALRSSGCKKWTVCAADFFAWLEANPKQQFDVALGNPPFIRYQKFPEPSRTLAMNLMVQEGLRPNKLTNIWVPFIVGAVSRLSTGGRLGMIVPAELLQVSYSAQLRKYLVDRFERIEIVACNEMFFQNAEQEVVLLLAEEKRAAPSSAADCFINLTSLQTVSELSELELAQSTKSAKHVEHTTEKWLKYFLSSAQIELMRELRAHPKITTLKTHAEVDVGVVTGKNEFFVLNHEQVTRLDLERYTTKVVGRSAQLDGVIFTADDLRRLAVQKNSAVYLLNVGTEDPINDALRCYVKHGETQEFHLGYKCKIREPWFSVPSIWTPHAFFYRQIYDFPHVVLNRTRATSTDTIHRMTCKGETERTISAIYSHLTAASAEIEGRSYGGGVLELEPTEAEHLLMPKELTRGLPIEEIDQHVRRNELGQILREHDRIILRDNLGLTIRECTMLREVWETMRDRRLSRAQKGKGKK